VLCARTPAARAALSADWRLGRVEKRYLALVSGTPERAAFDVAAAIGRVPHPRLDQVHAAAPAGKPALTHVRVVGPRAGGTLVEARIPTGRPHQIRIHLAVAGHPLLGDPLYAAGGGLRDDPALPGDGGYRLHAWRLAFTHPTVGRRVELECAPPPELR
jgi:23S rRNA pseudouridine1911/1915/1917 synthase